MEYLGFRPHYRLAESAFMENPATASKGVELCQELRNRLGRDGSSAVYRKRVLGFRDYRVYWGIYGDNGKENGNYYIIYSYIYRC